MIDEGLVHPWPVEVLEALERFEQGDLIESPPAVYSADPRYPLWRPAGDADENTGETDSREAHDDGPVLYELDPAPAYGIVTTQTCDLCEQRERPLQPFFQVAPVYRLEAHADERERGRVLERENIIAIPSPTGDQAQWVADLRVEFTLEKSMLAGREPICVLSEAEKINFAQELGVRRARPALANEIHDVIVRLISKKRSNNKSRSRPVFEQVHKVCLAIEQGGRRKPLAVSVIVVTNGALTEPVTEWFAAWEDDAREPARDVGITLHATSYRDATNFDLIANEHLINLL
ncbi:MAG TPA: hypothetical protein VK691_01865 [Solirubrobacteraceae bacterium]|nr:hypothetical protein [Solirubrobacteraceae bacterium]